MVIELMGWLKKLMVPSESAPQELSNKWSSVFSTAFELRGTDVPFSFMHGQKLGGDFFFFFLNVLLLKFDGL
jgi:hypothetical protein